jgi:glycosyltransferase involved in cell wall biosynthesis
MNWGTKRALLLVENLSVPTDRRVWQQAAALRRAGLEVTVICPRGTARDTEPFQELDGVAIHRYLPRFSEGGVAGYVKEYGSALFEMRRIIRRLSHSNRIDVIHAANPPDILLLAALPERKRGAALILDQHDLVPEQFVSQFGDRQLLHKATLLAERLAYKVADVVLVTNDSYKQVAVRRGHRDKEDVFVVRNAPSLERFRPLPPDLSLKRGRPFLVGYAGIMGPQDGVDHSLRALAELKERRDDWTAVFVGEGDALTQMQELAESLDLGDHVEFPGWASGDRLITILSTFDVCLAPNPKTPLNEVSTMVKLLEYMAMAKPVVAYDLGETRRTAADAAAYASPNDPVSLAHEIGTLLDDPERRIRMGAIGRARIEGALAWEHAERELLAAYDRAFDRASRR